jgi:hypothetical protein
VAYPGQRAGGAHPVGEGRDEGEILLDMLFANPAGGITRPADKLIVGPKIVSSDMWTASAIKRGRAECGRGHSAWLQGAA